MALTEETVQDKIEVVDNTYIQVRTATVIKRDGEEISRTFHRHSLSPSVKTDSGWTDTDISGESKEVQGICNSVWSDAVKKAYQEETDKNDER